ncbi:plasmid pRiA4b ORF-3 family protein [Atopobium sp. oral taxon 416]|uniref:plasmid pRiA4b ORF-3 family protein n=1 Tax=Atopobium sp. oral taxon 416 TaxID=712157 RepID=UPI001BAA7E5A|nr:plasmid pRiA4b ORF-3 family protein [Atopobium sp. oral taxon 416]QUC02817.1 plasmid pRiA4b ORF-3 family protein [Atopobium sp. oral taxon 416]
MDTDSKDLLDMLTLTYLALTSKTEGKGSKAKQVTTDRLADEALADLAHNGYIHVSKGPGERMELTPAGATTGAFMKELFSAFQQDIYATVAADSEKQQKPQNSAFKFHIELDLGHDLTCWRDIAVPQHITFGQFHEIIQSAFLWEDSHLFEFRLTTHGKKIVIEEDADEPGEAFTTLKNDTVDAEAIMIDEIFPRTKNAVYEYDFGDSWMHSIHLEETIRSYPGTLPRCTAGEGAAPPEDVGGVFGFREFLSALSDATNPDHDDAVEWADTENYGPFDLDEVNDRMQRWFNTGGRDDADGEDSLEADNTGETDVLTFPQK